MDMARRPSLKVELNKAIVYISAIIHHYDTGLPKIFLYPLDNLVIYYVIYIYASYGNASKSGKFNLVL